MFLTNLASTFVSLLNVPTANVYVSVYFSVAGVVVSSITFDTQSPLMKKPTTHPTIEWLDHVRTAKAKQAIINYLKRSRHNNIERGISIFEKRMHEFGITPSARLFRKLLPAYDCSNKDEFYSKLGSELINLNDVDVILRQNSKNKILKFWTFEFGNPFKGKEKDKTLVVKSNGDVSDADAPKFMIGECCNPIPGDSITGYRNAAGIIVVHKNDCEELTRLAAQHGDKLIGDIKWSSYKAESYLAEVEFRGIDRMGILRDLAQVITVEFNINIRELKIQSHDGIFEGIISVYVTDTENLNEMISRLDGIKGIEKVQRINK